MANIKILKEQLNDSKEIFKLTDRLRKYISDPVLNSEDPDTGEEIKLYLEDENTIRMEVYRRNRWVMECTYNRDGSISEFKPVKRW